MSQLRGEGVTIRFPKGWEGEIFRRSPTGTETGLSESVEVARNVVHLANFAMPNERGDFGSGAVEIMNSGSLLIILFEHGPESLGTPLFAAQGIPRVSARDFHPQQMQRALPGQSGHQVFFTHNDRPFCLYVVLGSHKRRRELVPVVNDVLSRIDIDKIS